MLLLQRGIGFQRIDYWYDGGLVSFKVSASFIAFMLTDVFFSPELLCVGPYVPSVAIYSTADKQSECRLGGVVLLYQHVQ